MALVCIKKKNQETGSLTLQVIDTTGMIEVEVHFSLGRASWQYFERIVHLGLMGGTLK